MSIGISKRLSHDVLAPSGCISDLLPTRALGIVTVRPIAVFIEVNDPFAATGGDLKTGVETEAATFEGPETIALDDDVRFGDQV